MSISQVVKTAALFTAVPIVAIAAKTLILILVGVFALLGAVAIGARSAVCFAVGKACSFVVPQACEACAAATAAFIEAFEHDPDRPRKQEAVRKIRQKVAEWDRQINEVRSGRSSLSSVDSVLLELLPPQTTRYINKGQRTMSYQQRVIRSQDPVKYRRLVEQFGAINTLPSARVSQNDGELHGGSTSNDESGSFLIGVRSCSEDSGTIRNSSAFLGPKAPSAIPRLTEQPEYDDSQQEAVAGNNQTVSFCIGVSSCSEHSGTVCNSNTFSGPKASNVCPRMADQLPRSNKALLRWLRSRRMQNDQRQPRQFSKFGRKVKAVFGALKRKKRCTRSTSDCPTVIHLTAIRLFGFARLTNFISSPCP